jgi:hypothetical protein
MLGRQPQDLFRASDADTTILLLVRFLGLPRTIRQSQDSVVPRLTLLSELLLPAPSKIVQNATPHPKQQQPPMEMAAGGVQHSAGETESV